MSLFFFVWIWLIKLKTYKMKFNSRRIHITIPKNIAHTKESWAQTKGNTYNNYNNHLLNLTFRILELPALLPRTNQTQERVSENVANTTTQDQTYMNPPFTVPIARTKTPSTKLHKEKKPAPETKAPSSSGTFIGRPKTPTSLYCFPRSHRGTSESDEQPEQTY